MPKVFLWEALGMTVPSSEKITNAFDVKVTEEDGFLSRCVGHERTNLNNRVASKIGF